MNEAAEQGLRALRHLTERIAHNQSVHVFEPTAQKYAVAHYPEKCGVCEWLGLIEEGLLSANREDA